MGFKKTIYRHWKNWAVLVFFLVSCKGETPIGKWKDGVIPYYLSGSFTDEEVTIIRESMDDWQDVANVSFIEVTPRAGAYKIIKVSANTWSSSVGENNSNCHMIFGSGGNVRSHVLHELGHALGLLHEHQRPDRDNYIRIIWDKLISQYQKNYDKKDNPLVTESKHAYDYNSIMHYPASSFSIDGSSVTMESLDASQDINRLGIITPLDAKKVQEIYGLPEDG